jgi:hypothetical protein
MSPRRVVGLALVATAIGCAGAAAVACLDTTPIYVAAPDAAPEPPPPDLDAGPDAPDVDRRTLCQQCVEAPDMPGPGCGDELATCLADDKCKGAYECVIAKSCLLKGTQEKVVLCGLPCAADAGITSQFEQAAVDLYGVASCALMACPKPCMLVTDAGAD